MFFDQLQQQLTSLPPATLIILIAIALSAFSLFPSKTKKQRSKRHQPTAKLSTDQAEHQPNMANPKHQMDAIAAVEFETRQLLNKEEIRVLPVLDRAVTKANQGHRVMAQTSLGEMLRTKKGADRKIERQAFASINSKRLDFAVIDSTGILVCAVEYQGSGHYRAGTFMRDAVKREVLRKAGVRLIEVMPDFSAPELEDKILKVIAPPLQTNP